MIIVSNIQGEAVIRACICEAGRKHSAAAHHQNIEGHTPTSRKWLLTRNTHKKQFRVGRYHTKINLKELLDTVDCIRHLCAALWSETDDTPGLSSLPSSILRRKIARPPLEQPPTYCNRSFILLLVRAVSMSNHKPTCSRSVGRAAENVEHGHKPASASGCCN